MSKRSRSITLFVVIAILFTAKAGLNIWPTTADEAPLNSVVASSTTAPIQLELQHEQLPLPLSVAQNMATDPWALLEAYLIPDASAGASAGISGAVIEDETLTSLRQYRDDLDQRSKQLDKREQTMTQAEAQLTRRITELEQLEASIEQRLRDEAKVKSKKIKRLTAVYEGMKADRAAAVIARMELATVVKVFLLMDEKKVGKILSFLPPEKAVAISQALTQQISTVK